MIWINEYDNDCDLLEGIGFLASSHDNNQRGARTVYYLRQHPGRTNMSGEPKLCAWLGETNNVSRNACGLARVVRIAKNGRVCLARVEATPELLEELGYPELLAEVGVS
jgi:hypothetical protein